MDSETNDVPTLAGSLKDSVPGDAEKISENIDSLTEVVENTDTDLNSGNMEEEPMEVDSSTLKSQDEVIPEDTNDDFVESSNLETAAVSEPDTNIPEISLDETDLNEVTSENLESGNDKSKLSGDAVDSSEADVSESPFVTVESSQSNIQDDLSLKNTPNCLEESSSNKSSSPTRDDKPEATTSDNGNEKNMVEPENTEFVQFSQDKNDDSQIENIQGEAEDPFGGDSFAAESVQPQTEETNNIPKLCNQSEDVPIPEEVDSSSNLENNLETESSSKETECNEILSKEPAEAPQNDVISLEDEESNNDPASVKSDTGNKDKEEKEEDKVDKDKEQPVSEITKPNESNKTQTAKETETTEPMETDQSSVLPGQDMELCIIPDSMKIIIPEKTVESVSESADSAVTKDKDKDVTITQDGLSKKSDEKSNDPVVAETSAKESPVKSTTKSVTPNEATKDDSKGKSNDKISNSVDETDVINLDDEPKGSEIEEIASKEICKQCHEEKSCKIKVKIGQDSFNVCSKECKTAFKAANNKATDIPSDGVNSKREKRCANCLLIVEANDERNLSWETMEFCNEECLGKFQTKYGSYCRNCNGSVQAVSLGKYCVRFGYDVRQFCCSTCLEEFKKGLKVCSYCQKDISSGTEGFLAPVGDKGQFKDFCTQDCMEKYSKMSSSEPPTAQKKSCGVCQEEKIVHCDVQIDRTPSVAICSEPCFAAFKFVNKVDPEQCSTCKKFFELPNKKNFVVFYENEAHTFCSKTCLNIFIITNRKIVPCNWCKVKKYNFDMIKKELKTGQVMMMCSLNCLTLYQVSINAVSAKRINCDFCKEFSQAQYHLTMSDATIRNFCSYNCVMNFQAQYTKSPITIPSADDPVPTGMPKRTLPQRTIQPMSKPNEIQNKTLPVISSVTSLATMGNGQVASPTSQQTSVNSITVPSTAAIQSQTPQVIYKQQIITRPSSPIKIHNKSTHCKPLTHTKGVSVRPHPCTKETQTDKSIEKVLIPIPVPIYVPYPVHTYAMPFPVPLPFPLPIPVPVFIPTTRNSAKGIFKEIKRIQEKIPSDPFEAELLMMAEMVATEKKSNESDSDSVDEREDNEGLNDTTNSHDFIPEGVDSSNAFGDDMLQMALKMATGELDETSGVDLEAALTPNTITATQSSEQSDGAINNDAQPARLLAAARGRKRVASYKPRSIPSKRGRRMSGLNDIPLLPPPQPQPPSQPRIIEPVEKPDANMALKYTFGVNAWRQWVIAKNAELEKQSTPTKKMKLFKTDLLQLTADELNYSLCLFVKEVRKPNGAEYAPDTIYYLCLGIQQYLFGNNRIDNIFTDSYYDKFTDCLNEVAKKFSVLYNDAQYIVTRVEEEHLWECKQLGAHSPHVLLNTLMFFNTKHFNLVTVEEHMQLSFSHIMKHWKRNPAAQPAAVTGKVPGSRNVLLRFYPPQSALEANSRKKKVYEQQENEDNPLRCPVKLYEFYLSKCPESVKTRNDVFYLLPERSCVPDSPVWYSTSSLAKEQLVKMLYRIKMVKEINIALLSS